ncbi:hypothetical protein BDV95DRAFT_587365 [Massariosphaeria phaeospora]|uniref:Uncharacterized protein n=1 Tax=Massariosphaeria phaeospora TaxID=100035 RepID=A0A7C8M6H2_9PLEO|nr:hypothetical protein BDV95DRAFT_587365 [Massariosphaeria phaeospora]
MALAVPASQLLRYASQPLRRQTALRPTSMHLRTFTLATGLRKDGPHPGGLSTNSKTKTDGFPDDKHAVNKATDSDKNNVQEANAASAMEAKGTGNGGNAVEERDAAGGQAKAKKEFPEAPDPAIGMQDQVGARGA